MKKSSKAGKPGSTSTVKKSVKILWRVVLGGLMLFLVLLISVTAGLFGKLPSLEDLENPQANLASEVYTDDGKTLMGKFYTENRSPVDYRDISPNVVNALIATEDERFYDHSGIDFKSLGRAVINLGSEGGGSTITQQLAKNMLGQGKGNPLQRGVDKLKEWVVAVKLEKNFTKEEIISLYLNRVPWLNVYGIRNASRTYFQKEPALLSVDESALLVGMLKGPGQYDPVRHPEAALARRNVVLEQMEKNSMIKPGEVDVLKRKPLGIKYKKIDENMGVAPYFRMVLGKKMDEWCKTHKDPKTGRNYDLYKDGLKIYTTINAKMQLYAEEAVVKHMTNTQKTFNRQLGKDVWKKHQDILDRSMKETERWKSLAEDGMKEEDIKKTFYVKTKMKVFAWNAKREIDTLMAPIDSIKYLKQMMQTSFAAMDPITGEVKAWVGGIDFKWFKFDHVTTRRQVGSTFKPILYTLALVEAGLTPESYIGGRAITLNNKTISGGGGTMAYCLAKSLNAAAYDLMARIGAKKTAEFAHQCGIESDIPIVPSIALGSADLTLIEMLRSYTMFHNRGFNTKPVIITRIEDKNGNVLETFQTETKQVISEADAYTMYKMMQGVVDFGTGRAMRGKYGIKGQMGGKTGTTNDNTDLWFIGYTPQLIAGTWVGCDDPFLRIRWTYGGNEMAMPSWAYFMQKVYADKSLGIDPNAQFVKPVDLENNPIYADQNFADIIRRGEGDDFTDQGNGDESDYTEGGDLAPVESEFKDMNVKETDPVVKPKVDSADKKATTDKNPLPKTDEKKDVKAVIPPKTEEKDKKKGAPVKTNDY